MALVSKARAAQSNLLSSIDETQLLSLLDAASSLFEKLTGREFVETERTEIYNGNDDRSLLLHCFPVSSLDSTEAVTITYSDGSTEVFTASQFNVDQAGGLIRFGDHVSAKFYEGVGNIAIKYTAGFSSIPEDIQQAVMNLAVHLYETGLRAGDVKGQKLASWSETYNNNVLPPVVRMVVNLYADWSKC